MSALPPSALSGSPAPQASIPPLPPRPQARRAHWLLYLALAVALGAIVYSWFNVHASVSEFFSGFFGRKGLLRSLLIPSFPPDLSQFWSGVQASVTTLCIAVLSLALGIIGSLALLPLAARNITPSRPLYEVTRLVMAVLRAIPELIMLLFILVTVGIGPFSAVLALTFHGIGVKGKLFAEAVEEMEMSPVEALRASGAGRIQVFLHAVLPGVRNTLTALTLYRLDANFRSAVTLGAVGGGGIGFLIDNETNVFEFKVVMTYIIILVVFVLAIERLSTILRRRLAT